ncbi:MAG: PBP1A family penicillin-binding protein [Candidatus Paceibacterota bacterium]|jgi:1A family penicillin-binding protein
MSFKARAQKIKFKKRTLKNLFFAIAGICILIGSVTLIWLSTIQMPDFKSFEDRKVIKSTKVYDRTGEILLYDFHQDIKRTPIPFSDMGAYIKNATVAIEDSKFYQHSGIRLTSFIRAVFANLTSGKFSQGGSTITQQIIKNTILSSEKTITRKLKEWILAIKLDQSLTKEEILTIYLNEAPYGGSKYGIYEAAHSFFGKEPKDLTLAESAYIAALPKGPSHYSPYGNYRDDLEERKNLVLSRMKEINFITEQEYNQAKEENVVFLPEEKTGIRAPHFVFFVKDYLDQKYGEDVVDSAGLKVITTLDYNLQKSAEETTLKYALINEKSFKGENAGLVAIDPKTGQILTMVGSRDYFDKNIQGNFNITTAKRQPGSSFKPFVYATAFNKGYTSNTVLFDLPTEFQTTCNPSGNAQSGESQNNCYNPGNYDDKFRGPMTLRSALAQSINVPAVKLLYLAGIKDSITTARSMGITTLEDASRYGLSLVLGGGEVKLLDMVSAYGTFATEGVRHPYQSILKVEDANGITLEEYTPKESIVLPKNSALTITDILSDEQARVPTFGSHSALYFPNRDVAVKTGTTNNYKDAWIVGYTPSLVVGAWAGNNDNTPMEKKTSGLIIAPLWKEFMNYAIKNMPNEKFNKPNPVNIDTTKPVMNGIWQGGEGFFIDTISGGLATEYTPPETKELHALTNVHSILYWVNRNDPLGPAPENPYNDMQFNHWEIPIQNWWAKNSLNYTQAVMPTYYDTVHTLEKSPQVSITSPSPETLYNQSDTVIVSITNTGVYPFKKMDVLVNGTYVGSSNTTSLSFALKDLTDLRSTNELTVLVEDSVFNHSKTIGEFSVTLE